MITKGTGELDPVDGMRAVAVAGRRRDWLGPVGAVDGGAGSGLALAVENGGDGDFCLFGLAALVATGGEEGDRAGRDNVLIDAGADKIQDS